jgi:hypothetical protein
MKLAVVGSRTFNDYSLLERTLLRVRTPITEIVSGGARGADSLAARWAHVHGVPLKEFLPDWKKYGKSAGFRRNREIIEYADAMLAFWDGISRGTKHDIDLAIELGKPYHAIRIRA